jgi:hypothetical protein
MPNGNERKSPPPPPPPGGKPPTGPGGARPDDGNAQPPQNQLRRVAGVGGSVWGAVGD